jgi:hypothetical protein
MQYQSTTMICSFLKLSKVGFLLKVAEQAKQATL